MLQCQPGALRNGKATLLSHYNVRTRKSKKKLSKAMYLLHNTEVLRYDVGLVEQ
jgi:hypothetical protein